MAAGELLARGLEVSHDGGGTWSVPDFTTPLVDGRVRPAHVILGFTSLVELPSGDWIARVSGHIPAGGGRLDWVVRSPDGATWDTVLGPGLDGCTDAPADTDVFGAAEPLVVGEDVLVAFACPGRDPSLHRISQDHERPVTVERLPPDRVFGAPMESNGDVVVPIVDAIGDGVDGFVVVDE